MNATKENRKYADGERVWAGKYKNSQNTLHWHSDCELICVERGKLNVLCRGQNYLIHDGDCLFFDSGELHRINAAAPDALLYTVIFDYALISDFATGLRLVTPKLTHDYGVQNVYRKIMSELIRKQPFYNIAAENSVVELMIDVLRMEPIEPKTPSSAFDNKYKALLNTVCMQCHDITLETAAKAMNMNTSYFSRLFGERTGIHFTKYVNCVRVEKAVQLLHEDDYTVTEVADICGFGTIRNFNRVFKLVTGYSPSALPKDYVFNFYNADLSSGADPTLCGCVIIESSS